MNRDQEQMVCLAMDAFRLCLGMKTRNFTRAEVIRWIRLQPLRDRSE